jgi:fatty-acyl-CoA synthase
MIEWWGPILTEFYSATEGNGATQISSEEWLAHKGSVGRELGCRVHVVDDDGEELAAGEIGTVYFEGGRSFEYHNAPEKTADSLDTRGWSTVGDIGYLDEEGYLYLTDRKADMIISGGVNIYPQETENCLLEHPSVADAAVFGLPDSDFGEQVKAVVEAIDPLAAGGQLADELMAWCRDKISPLKCPRSIDFVDHLPRTEAGKLRKHLLKARYDREPSGPANEPGHST